MESGERSVKRSQTTVYSHNSRTHEDLLSELLLFRSNEEINLLKNAYRYKYHRNVEDAVRGDLTFKTERCTFSFCS